MNNQWFTSVHFLFISPREELRVFLIKSSGVDSA